MNLLVKKLGLVFLPALFFACEDPTELGADLNPNTGAVSAHYVEIPVTTSQVSSDSLLTSIRIISSGGNQASLYPSPYIGRVENEDFGTIRASFYSNLGVPDTVVLPSNVFKFDSARLQVVWDNGSVYGKDISTAQQFNVHQLLAPISPTGRRTTEVDGKEIEWLAYNYYAANSEPLGPLLGQMTLDLSDQIAENLDTSALSDARSRLLSARLPQEMVDALYQRFRTDAQAANWDAGVFASQEAFNEYIKGIAIVPGNQNSFLTTLSLINELSGLVIYYQQGVTQKTLRIPFLPSPEATRGYDSYPAYFGVETDRSGTGLSNAPAAGHLLEFDATDDRVYFQGLTGIYPKVNFSGFRDLLLGLDAGDRIVINQAVLEFDSLLVGTERQPLPQDVELYFVGNDNRRFPSATLGGLERAISTTGRTYQVGDKNVNVIQSDLVYSLEQYMKEGGDRYLQAILYPSNPFFLRPNKFVIRPDQVKLKIWYTKLKEANL